jgi:uncharacterized repeat protein (TIGR01451 family)
MYYKQSSKMKRFLQQLALVCLLLVSLQGYSQIVSTNVVNYQITYNAVTDRYTAWVVPLYNVPNSNNVGGTEFGGTAQFTVKVPTSFSVTDIQDVNGTWEKAPLRLGPGNANQTWTGLDPAFNYYVVGKSPSETNYGSFQTGVPVQLFTFRGNGCFGPVQPLPAGDTFIAIANTAASLNVSNSFYSRSGQPAGGNVVPLEQFVNITGPGGDCRPISAIADSGTLTAGTSTTVNVLANDTNKGTPASTTNVTVSVSGQPTSGTATVNPNGTVTYSPAAGFTGVVSFTYTVCDKVSTTSCSSAPVSLTVLPAVVPGGSANIRIQKTASKPTNQTAAVSEVVQFTVVVTNLGPDGTTNLVVSDTIPAGTQLVSAVVSQGSYSSATSQWTVGSLSANGSATLVMQVKLLTEGVTYNRASVRSLDQTDANLTNNSASACVTVPVTLCQDEQLSLSIPSGYQALRWFKDGQVIANETGSTLLVSAAGSYTFEVANNSCPITGCCPVVVVAGNCCKPVCVPFVVTRIKKR